MRIKLQTENDVRTIPVRTMRFGEIGVVVDPANVGTDFVGEIIFCNVAGWHSLTASRYWPSDFMARKDGRTSYVPDFTVRLLSKGDALIVSEED